MKIVPLDSTIPIVNEKGEMYDRFRLFTLMVSQLGVDVGTGSPEGVVTAEVASLYMDDAGAAGSILYIKRDDNVAGDKSQGWVLI